MTKEALNEFDSRDVPKKLDLVDPRSSENEHASLTLREVPASVRLQPVPRGPLPLRNRDQFLFAVVCAFALFFMAAYCVQTSQWGIHPIEVDRQPERELDYKIELNSATWVEWCQLPGIGPVLARRIVDDREKNGPFRTLKELDRVKGIGPKKIAAIRAFIRSELGDISQRPAAAARPDGPPE